MQKKNENMRRRKKRNGYYRKLIEVSKLDSRHRVVIPSSIRDSAGLIPGMKLVVSTIKNRGIMLSPAPIEGLKHEIIERFREQEADAQEYVFTDCGNSEAENFETFAEIRERIAGRGFPIGTTNTPEMKFEEKVKQTKGKWTNALT
ncbi:MAG: AbrB/MazE/SpoVT family DNA-binding domain-containing protein [Candidatus Dojkabacteria bacterium]